MTPRKMILLMLTLLVSACATVLGEAPKSRADFCGRVDPLVATHAGHIAEASPDAVLSGEALIRMIDAYCADTPRGV